MKHTSLDKIIPYLLWLCFICLLAYLKFIHHELWKDEWQAWFVAKDKNLIDIFSFLYYEGHPALWYVYLKIFTVFTPWIEPVILINTAHLITVGLGLYFLFVKFRMPLFLKVLFALSYFVFFEYGLINRGYFLVILFTFWAVWLLSQQKYSRWHMGTILFLLCQTEVYGAFIAISLGFFIWLKYDKLPLTSKIKEITGLILGLGIFFISVFPRSAGHVAKTRGKELDFFDSVLTAFQGNLSNTYLIGSTNDTFTYGWTNIGVLLSVFCLFCLWYIFRKHPKIIATYALFLLMMISFSVLFFLGGIRQWGIGFVFLIAAIEWLQLDFLKEKVSTSMLTLFCIFNLVHGFRACGEEIKLPFTNAEKAGLFIKSKVPQKVPVVAINKFEATPVVGYAGRNFFELPQGVEFSYFRWVDKIYLPTESELKLFGKFKNVGGIVILSPKPLDVQRYPAVQLWQKFDTLNYKKENYYLYSLAVK